MDENHHDRDEQGHEEAGPDQIPAVVGILVGVESGHRYGVAACLANRGRQDLDDPEPERDLRNVPQRVFCAFVHDCSIRKGIAARAGEAVTDGSNSFQSGLFSSTWPVTASTPSS